MNAEAQQEEEEGQQKALTLAYPYSVEKVERK